MKFLQSMLVRVLLLIVISFSAASAKGNKKEDRNREGHTAPGVVSVSDRSFNILDANQLGQYVSNMGQFYSSWNEVAPEGEWPLNSGHEQMYRMNVFVGVPGNVVQTRTYGEKEWNPVYGFNNPDEFLPVSNDTVTWPLDEFGDQFWPVWDYKGKTINSTQSSYAVYRDSTNYLYLTTLDPANMLNIVVHQSSFAWNADYLEDIIVFKFDLVNDSDVPKDSVYFCLYTDFDCGGFDDYTDDLIGFEPDRQFYYFYDSDNWSPEWGTEAFYFGLVFLETPVQGSVGGLTDFHYTEYDDEPSSIADDDIQFGMMSSDSTLRDNPSWPNLFHGSDLHYDDVSLIPPTGMDLVCYPSSGPYHMEPQDTLTFITALIAGADYNEFSVSVDSVWEAYLDTFNVEIVPQPVITAQAEDRMVILSWDTSLDDSLFFCPQAPGGINSIIGYLIYKTEDPDRTIWGDPIDTVMVGTNVDPNYYSWGDSDVLNGFYYSYSVTAFDNFFHESGKATLEEDSDNSTVEVRPASSAQTNLNQIRVVPNPFVVSSAWDRERLGDIPEGEPIRDLSFINLPAQCTIKIFTLDGDLVKTLHHTDGTGTEYWDIRSDYNQMVSTGVYFYHVKSSAGDHLDKFAIIR